MYPSRAAYSIKVLDKKINLSLFVVAHCNSVHIGYSAFKITTYTQNERLLLVVSATSCDSAESSLQKRLRYMEENKQTGSKKQCECTVLQVKHMVGFQLCSSSYRNHNIAMKGN